MRTAPPLITAAAAKYEAAEASGSTSYCSTARYPVGATRSCVQSSSTTTWAPNDRITSTVSST